MCNDIAEERPAGSIMVEKSARSKDVLDAGTVWIVLVLFFDDRDSKFI
jgi:hypothetical protein